MIQRYCCFDATMVELGRATTIRTETMNRIFKTAVFKLHNLSTWKREALDYVLAENTRVIADAFEYFQENVPTAKEIRAHIPKGLSIHSRLREGIIAHVDAQYKAHKALKDDGGNPPTVLRKREEAVVRYETLAQQLVNAGTDEEMHNINTEMHRVNSFKYQPLKFDGYSNEPSGWKHSRFAILKNAKDKYYALMYILPPKQENTPIAKITDMVDIKYGEIVNTKAKGAILAPLSFSEKYHKERFMDVASIQSAQLSKTNGDYYLHVAFEFTEGGSIAENYIGVDVGMITPVAIAVINSKGKVLHTKVYTSDVYKLQAKNRQKIADLQNQGKQIYLKSYRTKSLEAMFHDVINQMIELSLEYNAAFVVEDLDGKFITRGKFVTSCYRKIVKFLEYKTAVAQSPYVQYAIKDKKTGEQKRDKDGNLKWAKFTVQKRWQGGTSKICHVCGEYGDRGKGEKRNYFECKCGYSGDADTNAAVNIARRILYKKDEWENHRAFHYSFSSAVSSTEGGDLPRGIPMTPQQLLLF